MTLSKPFAEKQVPDPAELRRMLKEGGIEVIGPAQAEELFARLNGAPDCGLSALHSLLQAEYGPAGGRGIALRWGRASFSHGLRRWGAKAGLCGSEFRLLPAPRRVRAGLDALGALLSREYASSVSLTEDARHWFWRVEGCPACHGRGAAAPDCHLLTGMVQEILTWAGGGRAYLVRELECQAAGAAACLFQIHKSPLD